MLKIRLLFLILVLLPVLITHADEALRHKIGQMIMVGFWGTEISDSLQYDIKNRNLGGIVTLANNLANPSQIKELTDSLQYMAETPLFISVDEEGGVVARLDEQNGFEATHTAYQMGTIFNLETTTRGQASKMAGWLESTGLNLNLAPVVDVNVNPNSPAIGYYGRSFSDNPNTVATHAAWFIDEFNEAGIITTLKHFPGHGSTEDDSHFGFTDVSNTWTRDELVPYEILLANGFSGMIMTGHLVNANIDSLHPATLSKLTLNGLLRDGLGYKGVVVSDAMYMRAIQDNYDFEEAIELAINAGVDILLYTTHMRDSVSLVGTIIDIVEEKVTSGLIAESVIDASYDRIMNLKACFWVPEGVDDRNSEQTPQNYSLFAYPNPFNDAANLVINLPQAGYIRLELFNVRGQRIDLVLEGYYSQGNHQVQIDGGRLSSGIYFLRLSEAGDTSTLKLSLIK
ncbi:T9SS type A sorting domain-containing protein [bacterium]|nr:T9SS type A sorting domain-containing protein [bacterium]